MKPLFVLTPEARDDLKSIVLDIAEDSPDTAQRLRTEFFEGLKKLARDPGIGHFHEELLGRKYRFWNFYSYVVAYAWEPSPIQILSVIHGSRDLAVLFSLRAERWRI